MAARHADELRENEGVLDIARGLLSAARYESQVAQSRNVGIKKGDSVTPDVVTLNDNSDEDLGLKGRAVNTNDEESDAKRRGINVENETGGDHEDLATSTAIDNKEKQAEETEGRTS